ncbi:MAG TPA: flotillin family protein [Coleofasciculaceae cyanobacterium]
MKLNVLNVRDRVCVTSSQVSRSLRRMSWMASSLAASVAIASASSAALASPAPATAATASSLVGQTAAQAPSVPTTQLTQIAQPVAQAPTENSLGFSWLLVPVGILGGVVIAASCAGLVVISEREVGIVVKKVSFSGRQLPPGRLIALNGEAGYQADTLAPGWHWGYWPWQFSVRKEPMIVVPQGEIALIVANDGDSIPLERILGKVVPCDNFQNAREFLTNGGEKGRQIGFLTAGTYRINTALFKVITAANASSYDMQPADLAVYALQPDKVGVVTTLAGAPIDPGEIAGHPIPNHDNFQNGQKFIEQGGRRGLQQQILLSGSWNLNPWFVRVEQVPMTEIPIGYVGVVVSFVGDSEDDVSGAAFTHGNLVKVGNKGVWVEPLYPGKHPINSRVMKVELVPTINIVLNWSSRTERHKYDANLEALRVRSNDGFAFDLEVSQIIHVGALDAPKVISRVGSMQNLVDNVLEPSVGNYFRNSAQDYTVLDFLNARSERQTEAAEYIKTALRSYDVQAIDTLIGDIQPPAELMQTQIDRKMAEEQRKTFEVQQMAQAQRQQLVRETSLADIQQELVRSEQSVTIAELKANAQIKHATGEAESIRLKASGEASAIRDTGAAKADTYRAGVEALGEHNYTAMQVMQIIGESQVRLIPDVLVGGNGSNNGLVDGLLSLILWNQTGNKPFDPKQVMVPATDGSASHSAPPKAASNGISISEAYPDTHQ